MKSVAFRSSLLGIALIVPLLAILAVSVARPSTAVAHPLGNFTVNLYSRLELFSDVIRVHYVLDMAEIPTFREVDAVDTDGDDALSDVTGSHDGGNTVLPGNDRAVGEYPTDVRDQPGSLGKQRRPGGSRRRADENCVRPHLREIGR